MKNKPVKFGVMKNKNQKVGFYPIVGAMRFTVKEGKKTKVFDVFKKKGGNNES